VMTIKGGQVVVEDGTVLSEPGIGSFIRRSK
jgi:formylmethanofuran dehydrogenase subunit A